MSWQQLYKGVLLQHTSAPSHELCQPCNAWSKQYKKSLRKLWHSAWVWEQVAETYEGQSLIVLRPKPDALKKVAKDAVAKLASTR